MKLYRNPELVPLFFNLRELIYVDEVSLSMSYIYITQNQMNNLRIRIVFDKNGYTKKDSKRQTPVYIEVLELPSKRKRYIPTGVKILAGQYSSNGGFSIKSHPNAIVLKKYSYWSF